jgi:hypothetical protein
MTRGDKSENCSQPYSKLQRHSGSSEIVTSAEYIKWCCCPPPDKFCTIAEAWIDRGDLLSSAHATGRKLKNKNFFLCCSQMINSS